jgi:hypothetical protein
MVNLGLKGFFEGCFLVRVSWWMVFVKLEKLIREHTQNEDT